MALTCWSANPAYQPNELSTLHGTKKLNFNRQSTKVPDQNGSHNLSVHFQLRRNIHKQNGSVPGSTKAEVCPWVVSKVNDAIFARKEAIKRNTVSSTTKHLAIFGHQIGLSLIVQVIQQKHNPGLLNCEASALNRLRIYARSFLPKLTVFLIVSRCNIWTFAQKCGISVKNMGENKKSWAHHLLKMK